MSCGKESSNNLADMLPRDCRHVSVRNADVVMVMQRHGYAM